MNDTAKWIIGGLLTVLVAVMGWLGKTVYDTTQRNTRALYEAKVEIVELRATVEGLKRTTGLAQAR